MPEAYSETQEIQHEIRRVRPEWLRASPNVVLHRRLAHDWRRSSGGFWDRVRKDTDGEIERISDAPMMERARRQALMLREDANRLPPSLPSAPLTKNLASFSQPAPGWDGAGFELWRMDGYNCLRTAIAQERHAYVDWLDGEIDLDFMMFQDASLVQFWSRDVQLLLMPRHWLRSAFEFLQRFHRVTDGTPGDCQLGTYLVDADLLLSADKNLVRIAERCRKEAPFAMARSHIVPAGHQSIEATLELLQRPSVTL
jgi:hypothetical protein